MVHGSKKPWVENRMVEENTQIGRRKLFPSATSEVKSLPAAATTEALTNQKSEAFRQPQWRSDFPSADRRSEEISFRNIGDRYLLSFRHDGAHKALFLPKRRSSQSSFPSAMVEAFPFPKRWGFRNGGNVRTFGSWSDFSSATT